MKVRLLKRQKVDGEAGEIVEVSPERAGFLISAEAAVKVEDAGEQAAKPEPEKPKALAKLAEETPKTNKAKTAKAQAKTKAPAKKK